MDAAASPLPREETTPPVTKMYLVACPSGLLIRFRSQREKGPHPFSQVRISKAYGPPVPLVPSCRRGGNQPAQLFEVFGRVDAERVVLRFHGFDADPMFERAELLERFRPLERRRLERREHEQGAAPIGVQPHVPI